MSVFFSRDISRLSCRRKARLTCKAVPDAPEAGPRGFPWRRFLAFSSCRGAGSDACFSGPGARRVGRGPGPGRAPPPAALPESFSPELAGRPGTTRRTPESGGRAAAQAERRSSRRLGSSLRSLIREDKNCRSRGERPTLFPHLEELVRCQTRIRARRRWDGRNAHLARWSWSNRRQASLGYALSAAVRYNLLKKS